jgi:hypothetical protein
MVPFLKIFLVLPASRFPVCALLQVFRQGLAFCPMPKFWGPPHPPITIIDGYSLGDWVLACPAGLLCGPIPTALTHATLTPRRRIQGLDPSLTRIPSLPSNPYPDDTPRAPPNPHCLSLDCSSVVLPSCPPNSFFPPTTLSTLRLSAHPSALILSLPSSHLPPPPSAFLRNRLLGFWPFPPPAAR